MEPGSSKSFNILRVSGEGVSHREDPVATEEPLEIQLSYTKRGGVRVTKSVAITMRTPGDDAALAAGVLFTEGILRSRDQVGEISELGGGASGNTVRVTLHEGVEVDLVTRLLREHG